MAAWLITSKKQEMCDIVALAVLYSCSLVFMLLACVSVSI